MVHHGGYLQNVSQFHMLFFWGVPVLGNRANVSQSSQTLVETSAETLDLWTKPRPPHLQLWRCACGPRTEQPMPRQILQSLQKKHRSWEESKETKEPWCLVHRFRKKSHQTLNLRLQIVPNKPRRWSSSTTFSFSAFPSFLAITIQPSVLFWHIMLHLWVMAKPTALTVITSRLSSIHSQSVHESSQPPVAVRHSPRWSEVANMHTGYVLHMPVQMLHKCDCTGLHRHKCEVSSL